MASEATVDGLIVQLMAKAHAANATTAEVQDLIARLPGMIHQERVAAASNANNLKQQIQSLKSLNGNLHAGTRTLRQSSVPPAPAAMAAGRMSDVHDESKENHKLRSMNGNLKSELDKAKKELAKTKREVPGLNEALRRTKNENEQLKQQKPKADNYTPRVELQKMLDEELEKLTGTPFDPAGAQGAQPTTDYLLQQIANQAIAKVGGGHFNEAGAQETQPATGYAPSRVGGSGMPAVVPTPVVNLGARLNHGTTQSAQYSRITSNSGSAPNIVGRDSNEAPGKRAISWPGKAVSGFKQSSLDTAERSPPSPARDPRLEHRGTVDSSLKRTAPEEAEELTLKKVKFGPIDNTYFVVSMFEPACLNCQSSGLRCNGKFPCSNCGPHTKSCVYLPRLQEGERENEGSGYVCDTIGQEPTQSAVHAAGSDGLAETAFKTDETMQLPGLSLLNAKLGEDVQPPEAHNEIDDAVDQLILGVKAQSHQFTDEETQRFRPQGVHEYGNRSA